MDLREQQKIVNDEHLKLLRIGFIIQGAVTAMMFFLGLLYVGMGILFTSVLSEAAGADDSPLQFMGIMYTVGGLFIIVVVAALTAMYFLSAVYLQQRRNRVFILIAAGLSCLSIPWGTAIGISTFIVLGRAEVKDEFDGLPPIEERLNAGRQGDGANWRQGEETNWQQGATGRQGEGETGQQGDEMPPIPPPPGR